MMMLWMKQSRICHCQIPLTNNFDNFYYPKNTLSVLSIFFLHKGQFCIRFVQSQHVHWWQQGYNIALISLHHVTKFRLHFLTGLNTLNIEFSVSIFHFAFPSFELEIVSYLYLVLQAEFVEIEKSSDIFLSEFIKSIHHQVDQLTIQFCLSCSSARILSFNSSIVLSFVRWEFILDWICWVSS